VAIDTPQALQRTLEGRLLGVRVDRLRRARATVLALPGVSGAAIFGDQLHLTVDDAARRAPEVERALAAQGFTVTAAAPLAAGLEDVFIARLAEQEPAPATAGAP
jgi:ABC-2 type transport system ATP-binding protein